MNPFKRIILWDYSRGTWQYDVLCLLIIAFIFLTPKTWFDRREKLATQTASVTGKFRDSSPEQIENRAKELGSQNEAQNLKIQEQERDSGMRSYENETR